MLPHVPEAKTYVIYGHSAGGQFSHRLCYFEGMMSAGHPEYPRIEKALIANPGWYTMPDTSMYYPYGLDRTPLPDMKALLEEFVRLPKVLLLGGQGIHMFTMVYRHGNMYFGGSHPSPQLVRLLGFSGGFHLTHKSLPTFSRDMENGQPRF